jgi:hypothetical protein
MKAKVFLLLAGILLFSASAEAGQIQLVNAEGTGKELIEVRQ